MLYLYCEDSVPSQEALYTTKIQILAFLDNTTHPIPPTTCALLYTAVSGEILHMSHWQLHLSLLPT